MSPRGNAPMAGLVPFLRAQAAPAQGVLRRVLQRGIQLVPVALSVQHDDGLRSRHLCVTVNLPAVPRVGERVRAGGVGSYLTVDRVLWDEGTVMVMLDPVSEPEHRLIDLLDRGWRARSQWSSVPAVAPVREIAATSRTRQGRARA